MENLLQQLRTKLVLAIQIKSSKKELHASLPAALSELDEILRDLRNYDLPRGPIREKFCRVMIRIGESGMLTDPDILGDS